MHTRNTFFLVPGHKSGGKLQRVSRDPAGWNWEDLSSTKSNKELRKNKIHPLFFFFFWMRPSRASRVLDILPNGNDWSPIDTAPFRFQDHLTSSYIEYVKERVSVGHCDVIFSIGLAARENVNSQRHQSCKDFSSSSLPISFIEVGKNETNQLIVHGNSVWKVHWIVNGGKPLKILRQ